jgi:hypothetical protein
MRLFRFLCLSIGLAMPALAAETPAIVAGEERPGATIAAIRDPGEPADCAQMCSETAGCLAWTLIEDSSNDEHTRRTCYLRSEVRPPVPNGTSWSGLRAIALTPRPKPTSWDEKTCRDGDHYATSSEPNTPDQCQYTCGADIRCLAWSHRYSSGDGGRCRLFDDETAATYDPFCTSGVKDGAPIIEPDPPGDGGWWPF